MKNQYNILIPLLVCGLLLIGIFFIRTKGIGNMEKELTKYVKNIVYNNTNLQKLRSKSIEALEEYSKGHIKTTGELDDRLSMHISYELIKLEDMYSWFKMASNNAKPQIQHSLISGNKKCTKYIVQDNETDSTGRFYVVLKVFDHTSNSGLIGVLTYINTEWNPNKNIYETSKIIIDLYVPDSDYFRDY